MKNIVAALLMLSFAQRWEPVAELNAINATQFSLWACRLGTGWNREYHQWVSWCQQAEL